MALILIEGFDHYSSHNADQKGWGIATDLFAGPGRNPFPPSQSIEVVLDNGTGKNLPGSYSELILGFAFRVSDLPSSLNPGVRIAKIDNQASVGIEVGTDVLCLGDSTSIDIAAGTTPISPDTWYYVELHATNTHAEIRLNGVTEIASTAGVFTAPWTRISFEYQQIGFKTNQVDDVYVIDPTTGPGPTTFLGPVMVRTLYPGADATYTDFVPQPSAAHHCLNVNERFIDYDTTMVRDGTAGHKDSYKIRLYGNDTIYGAQLNLGARAGDFGSRQIEPLIRQAGTDYTGSTSTLTNAYLFYSWLLNQDPTGSNWTVATVDADEFGMEVVS